MFGLRKLLVPALLLAGMGIIAYGCFQADTEPSLIGGSSGLLAIQPIRDGKIVAQDPVGVQLSPGFQGSLKINGVDIPPEELDQADGLNRLLFRAGSGKVIKELRANENCAEVTFWRIEEGPKAASAPLRWCFKVV